MNSSDKEGTYFHFIKWGCLPSIAIWFLLFCGVRPRFFSDEGFYSYLLFLFVIPYIVISIFFDYFFKMMVQIPLKHRLYFYLTVLTLFIITSSLLLFFNFRTNYQNLRDEERTLIISKSQKEDEVVQLNKLKEQVEELDEQLQLVSLKFPNKKDISSLLTSINELAENSNLIVENYSSRPEKEENGVIETQMLFELKGEFLQIQRFLTELGQLKRLIKVKLISLSSDSQTNNSGKLLNIECLVTAYYIN